VVAYEAEVDPEICTLLFDPQTAGGLLIAIAPQQAAELTHSLHQAGVRAIEVGEVLPEAKPLITVAA
jgi:selenide,water dikinase